jgi:hypothetical protein
MHQPVLTATAMMIVCGSLTRTSGEPARTVTPDERALLYALPAQCTGNYNCMDWTGVGAYLGQFIYQQYFDAIGPGTLKLLHARFHVFSVFDNYTEALFPYAYLLQYDASEIAAGKPSLFVTATYKGRKRAVLWNWSDDAPPLYANNPFRTVI